MSTKNFVGYGDAESLMSGIKSAIDDAGGGGGSLEKVVVSTSAVTNQSVAQALQPFLNKFLQLTDEQRRCCFIDIYGTSIQLGATARLYFLCTQGSGNSVSKIFFGNREAGDGGMCAMVTNDYSQIYIANTSYQSNTLASQGWTKFELSYMNYRSAVVPSGETVVASYTGYENIQTALYNLALNFPKNISADIVPKLKLRIKGQTNYGYNVGIARIIKYSPLSDRIEATFIGDVFASNSSFNVYKYQLTSYQASFNDCYDIITRNSVNTVGISGKTIEIYYEN